METEHAHWPWKDVYWGEEWNRIECRGRQDGQLTRTFLIGASYSVMFCRSSHFFILNICRQLFQWSIHLKCSMYAHWLKSLAPHLRMGESHTFHKLKNCSRKVWVCIVCVCCNLTRVGQSAPCMAGFRCENEGQVQREDRLSSTL